MTALLVGSKPAEVRLLRQLLADAEGFAITVEYLERPGQDWDGGHADVVLLDLAAVDGRPEVDAWIREQAARTPVIVLATLDQEETALRAIGEGAQDYLIKPHLSTWSMIRSIRCAMERHRTHTQSLSRAGSAQSGTVWGLAGAKGGVGTTTVALNVAAALAQDRTRVIAVELAPGGGGFALQLGKAASSESDWLFAPASRHIGARQLQSRLCAFPWGVQVLFAPSHAEAQTGIPPERVEAIIEAAASQADYVIVDLPPLACSLSRDAVRQCDLVALVADRERACLAAGRNSASVLRAWGVAEAALGVVIVNRTPLAVPLSLSEIRAQSGSEILGVILHDAETLEHSYTTGVPLVVSHPENPAAQSLRALGDWMARGTSGAGVAKA